MAENEDFFLPKILADPCDQLLGVSDHALGRQSRRDRRGIGEQIRLSGCPLIPMDDGEVLLPPSPKPPAHGHGHIARTAVQHDKHGISAIGAADRDPLLDATDPNLLQPLNSVWRDDLCARWR
jgi:hypothetical protein